MPYFLPRSLRSSLIKQYSFLVPILGMIRHNLSTMALTGSCLKALFLVSMCLLVNRLSGYAEESTAAHQAYLAFLLELFDASAKYFFLTPAPYSWSKISIMPLRIRLHFHSSSNSRSERVFLWVLTWSSRKE